MICANCGTENPPGAKFCQQCGMRLATACPTCGSVVQAGARFCGECGTPLIAGASSSASPAPDVQPGPAPSSAHAPQAERRLVSVLFADLVGFTALSAERDPEDTRELLSRYFDLTRDVLSRYGGTVEKFIGDAVMAVWGAPVAREDDAERAVRAALEIVDAVRALGPSIQARAGVLTGEAAVTLGAAGQGMVAGDLVNTASRLQSVARPGTVLVGDATQRAASRSIAFEEAGPQTLKGKTSPVPAYRALRVVAQRGGRNRSIGLEAPFVGRDDELRLLKDLFHATVRERRARLVSVMGQAGIGKSRLAWEFLKYVDGVVETVWWHDGRSPAYGDGITFWALGEMVRERCGLLETDDEATTRTKVAEVLARHVPDPDERRWIEPALLSLLGKEGGVASEQLFGAWRTFFERLSASAPVVLVFEDFHFADSGLIDFVDHLMEWSRGFPIYVLTLARLELLDKRPNWGAGKHNFNSLHLEPLPDPAMRALLLGLVPGLQGTAVRAIVSRADGVPLYAVETVRMLIAEGNLELRGETYVPIGDLSTLAVPETLAALIASRLDALSADDRAVLSDAAVLGQSFTRAALAAVAGLADADLEPRLRSLVKRELLSVEADPRSPERGQYAFVQALIREVAYNTLARADRKTRHLAAARYFESLDSDELAGALAGQYLAARANATGGPESDALAAQARVALKGAAERASALGAHDQAQSFFEQALTIATDPGEQAHFHERAAESAEALQRFDDADAHLRAALGLHEAAGDRTAQARTTAALGSTLLHAYRLELAVPLLADASMRFADLGDDPARIALESQLARAYFLHDEDARAVAVADHVLEAAERAERAGIVADTLVTRGSALVALGRPYEGVGAIEAGQKLAAAQGFRRIELRALNNLSSCLLDSDPRAALGAAREGIAVTKRLGDRMFNILNNAFWAALRTGDWDWVASELEPMLDDELDPLSRAIVLVNVMTLRSARGEPTSALMAYLEAVPTSGADEVKATTLIWARAWSAFTGARYEIAASGGRRYAEIFSQGAVYGIVLAARCALLSGNPDGARDDVVELDRIGRRGRVIDADRTTIRAGIAAFASGPDEATALYRQALRSWRDLGLVWDEALCAIDMTTLLDPAHPEVRAAAATARESLVRLRAIPFVERLDAALGRDREAPHVAPLARDGEVGARTVNADH